VSRERTPRPRKPPPPPARHLTSIPPSSAAAAALGARPATIVIAAPDVGTQQALEHVARALGMEILASGNGPSALDRARAALRRAAPPTMIVHGAAGAEALVAAAQTLTPRPVLLLVGAGSIDVAAARAASLDVELAMVAPFTVDRAAPVLLAAARLAFERFELHQARAAEHLLRRRLQVLTDTDEHSGLHTLELVRRMAELELRRGKRYGYPLAAAVVLLDGIYGVDRGAGRTVDRGVDRILAVRAAAALTGAIRDIDLGCELDDGRYFVLLPHTDRAAAGRIAHRLVTAVAEIAPVSVGGAIHRVRATAGVTSSARGAGSFERLLADALAALDRARREAVDVVVAT